MTKLSPEDFLAKAKSERRLIEKGADKRLVAKIMRLLAPVYGYDKIDVTNAWDVCTDDDLLTTIRCAAECGHYIPAGLIIGGHKGLSYGDLLSLKFRELQWWLKFRQHIDIYNKVIWVLPIKGTGYWVITNTDGNSQRRQPAIVIPARTAGLNHVRVMRLELFIEEHSDE